MRKNITNYCSLGDSDPFFSEVSREFIRNIYLEMLPITNWLPTHLEHFIGTHAGRGPEALASIGS